MTDLKLKAQTCQFDTLRDSMIRDRIVLGVWSQRVRERLLREDDLDLGKAVKICQAAEVTERQIETLSQKCSDGEANVHYNRGRHNPKHKPVQTHSKHKPKTNFTKCSCCDTAHAPRACPAFNKSCNACCKSGHFARVCRSKPKVRYVSRDESTDPTELFVGMVKADHDTRDERWSQNLRVEGKTISFKLDTGSDGNIISELEYRTITPKPKLEKSETVMTSYSGGPIPSLGVCCVSVQYKKRHIYAYMEVVRDERRPALLGGTDCARLGLVKRVHAVTTKDMKSNILKSHLQLFHGSGSLPGVHTIVLKDDAAPVIHAPRRVAVAKRPQLKRELDRQVSQGFLAKVIKPTDWVNSLVIVEKANGQMRLCIDPKDLNKVVKREHFQIPTKEEILGKLRDAKWFSKLDATAGFHQIKLDRPSSMLTTFNTPFGRYRYLRLPMGICSAPEVFHKTVHQFLEEFDGVTVYMDDIIVWGSTVEEHDERLMKALERLSEVGLVLNAEKCVFRQSEIEYLGEVVTQDGVKPDPNKIQAITEVPTPRDILELQRVLGMVTYLGRFIPNLSVRTAALRSLLVKGNDWQWHAEHEAAWNGIKETLSKHPVLQYYDESKALKVSTDASKDGIGAVLLQETEGQWMPVAYASRSMTAAERNYAQIEKEQLGVVFACERFHVYIYVRRVIVETDHCPLIAISRKHLCDAPPRLQRLLLRIQKYDLKLEYTPGKLLVVADTLSRAFSSKQVVSSTESEVHVHVCSIKSGLPVSERKWAELAAATENDGVLHSVISCITDGENNCPRPYVTFVDELSVVDGVLLKGQRVVVPGSMKTQMLTLIHEGHLGIEKCKRRARDILYWPNMNKDVYETVSRCDVCQEYRYAQPKQPLTMHERPDRPWAKVGFDLFFLKQTPYLLTVDYYSHYPEIALLSNESGRQVIVQLKSLFARHGIPSTLMSDGGPQFSSAEFRQFTNEWGIEHKMSSPYYPQSNGLVENCVKVVKRILGKAGDRGEDPYLAMLAYRSSPLDCGKSPSELLFARKIRSRLPYRCETYIAKSPPNDRGKSLTALHPNDTVRVKDPRRGRWPVRAKVIRLSGPRSYDVLSEDGRLMRRNRQHLMTTRELFTSAPTDISGVSHNAEQPTTVPTSTAIETSSNAIPCATETVAELPSTTSSPLVERRSERVRKAPVRLDL